MPVAIRSCERSRWRTVLGGENPRLKPGGRRSRLRHAVAVPHTTSVIYGGGWARRAVRRALEERPPPAVGHLAPPRLPKGNARQPITSMHAHMLACFLA